MSFSFLDSKKRISPVINILTRTSGRPEGFKICYNSVKNQTYKNSRHIVSYDRVEDLDYLENYEVDKIKVEATIGESEIAGNEFKPYNLYCNNLLAEVKEGWIMFLDDDDRLANPKVLKLLKSYISKGNEDTIFIFQTTFPNNHLLPSNRSFKYKSIELEDIDTACFMFHSKYKDCVKWDNRWAADFRFITALSKIIPNQIWIPKIISRKGNFGDGGKRNDIIRNGRK